MNLLDLRADSWWHSIIAQAVLDRVVPRFTIAGPCRLAFHDAETNANISVPLIGEEEVQLCSVFSKAGFGVYVSIRLPSDTANAVADVPLSTAVDLLDESFTRFLIMLVEREDALEHAEAHKDAMDRAEQEAKTDELSIKKGNPVWGTW